MSSETSSAPSSSSPSTATAAAATSSLSSSSVYRSFTLPRPADDFHLHVREGPAVMFDILSSMLSRHSVARGIIMPNTIKPIVSVRQAEEYRDEINEAVRRGDEQKRNRKIKSNTSETAEEKEEGIESVTAELTISDTSSSPSFTPLMTLYLTAATTTDDIKQAKSARRHDTHISTRKGTHI
jgi:dihydroorotase